MASLPLSLPDKMMHKLHAIIDHFLQLNPSLVYYIENPRGMLRKMPFMRRHMVRHTVTYCQYGDTRMKPTDIWTNTLHWVPNCRARMAHHATHQLLEVQRLAQGLKGNYERSKIPHQLCLEVLNILTYA